MVVEIIAREENCQKAMAALVVQKKDLRYIIYLFHPIFRYIILISMAIFNLQIQDLYNCSNMLVYSKRKRANTYSYLKNSLDLRRNSSSP